MPADKIIQNPDGPIDNVYFVLPLHYDILLLNYYNHDHLHAFVIGTQDIFWHLTVVKYLSKNT